MSDRNPGDVPDQPDPMTDTWSAWLPRLDPPTPRLPQAAGPPEPVIPQPQPPPTKPAYAVSPPWAPPVPQAYRPPPPTRLLAAILCTLFCFMPFGIVAIVRAISVRPKWAQGRWDDAYRASRSAKTWCVLAALVWPGSALFFACSGIVGLAFHH